MNDWIVANYVDPEDPVPNGIWVYKKNRNFPNLHLSLSVDIPSNNHVATDAPPPSSYYYGSNQHGARPHFAGVPPNDLLKASLIAAWKDYYTV
jgi:hypothetical protein